MQQIDQDARRHSHLYELKPMSRWWVVAAAAMTAILAFGAGMDRPITWALVLIGMIFGWSVILAFPNFWLSKLKD